MKIDKKANEEARAAYLVLAAELRAKIVAENRNIEGEILPVHGVLHLDLGKPLSKERRAKMVLPWEPCIDIPEVRGYGVRSK